MLDLDKPVQTRAGEPARIVCRDAVRDQYPIIAMVKNSEGQEYPRSFTIAGKHRMTIVHTDNDLINVPEPETEYLFVGGAADGRRIKVPDSERYYWVPVPGGGAEEYQRACLASFSQARYVFISSRSPGTGALDELIKQYPAAAPAEPVEAGPAGTNGGDGVFGVRADAAKAGVHVVWSYGPGGSLLFHSAHTNGDAADHASRALVIKNLGWTVFSNFVEYE